MDAEARRPIIAYITDRPGAHSFGRKARTLAKGFTELDVPYDAVFACVKEGDGRIGDPPAREVCLGAPRAALSVRQIVRYLSSARPTLALVNSGQLGPAATIAGKIAGVPVLPWEATFYDLDMPEMPPRQRATVALQNLLYKRGPGAIVPSDDLAAWVMEHRRLEPSRIFKVPNPVDVEAVRASLPEDRANGADSFTMSAVGRLVAQKGWDVLIDALRRANPDLPEGWRMTLIGAEVPRMRAARWGDRLRESLEEHGLEDRVELIGRQEDPPSVVGRSHLFVHAARWEPFGNVLTEALALGMPIVATDCPGGPREILDGGRYGRLVPNEDAGALAEALVELASDPKLRVEMSRMATLGAERYRPREVAATILAVAEDIGPARSGGSPAGPAAVRVP